MILTETFNQHDPRWGAKRMGDTQQTIAFGGCNVTCIAMALPNYRGIVSLNGGPITPAEVVDRLHAVGGFPTPDGYPEFRAVERAFPALTHIPQVQTENNPIRSYIRTPVPEAIANIKLLLDLGIPVLIGVNADRSDAFQDHFVLAWDYDIAPFDLRITDPGYGERSLLSKRYGPASSAIYSYTAYFGEAIGFPDGKMISPDFMPRLNKTLLKVASVYHMLDQDRPITEDERNTIRTAARLAFQELVK